VLAGQLALGPRHRERGVLGFAALDRLLECGAEFLAVEQFGHGRLPRVLRPVFHGGAAVRYIVYITSTEIARGNMNHVMGNASDTLIDSVREWVAGWGAEVAAADIRSGRQRFADDLVAFGTHADVVAGRE